MRPDPEPAEHAPGASIGYADRATAPPGAAGSPSSAAVRMLFDRMRAERQDAREGEAAASLQRGAIVGRYVVIGVLGKGGMGVVYSVFDPELDRKVALKLILPGSEGDATRARLVREAQALAKLAHPNVVAVYDAGTHDGQLWIAMEFVPGQTLRAWSNERPRSWTEAVRVLIDVARGVAAAHSVGLVHRDLKPENVMVDQDGRVRVMDFGLAHGRSVDPSDLELAATHRQELTGQSRLAALVLRLTQAGALLGTPSYMAPEQWEGKDVEAAADQFGWCVMAWELLYGERPFAGDTVMALAASVLSGQRRTPASARKVPRWLKRVIQRGLAVQPAQRWPSLAALVEELMRARTRARLWVAGAVLVSVAVLVGGGLGWRQWEEARRAAHVEERRGLQISRCEDEGAAIAAVWNDTIRKDVRVAFTATGVHHAAVAADKLVPWLDKQANDWRQVRTDVCLDAELHATLQPDAERRALWCLDERRMGLEALIAELLRADGATIQRAVPVASTLRQVSTCKNTNALNSLPAPPPERREDARRVLADLSTARSLDRMGAYERGAETARRGLAGAEALAWPPLTAQAQLQLGTLLGREGKYSEAEPMLEAAFFAAAKGGAPDVAYATSVELMYTVGYKLGRLADGLRWANHADVILAEIGDAEGVRAGSRLNCLAIMYTKAGRYDEATELFEQVLKISEDVFGANHPDVAKALNNLGLAHYSRTHYETARDLHLRALTIRRSALGEDHVDVAGSLDGVGKAYLGLGDIARARPFLEESLAICERVLGAEHPEVAMSLENLAVANLDAGEYAAARPNLERALAIKTRIFDDEHEGIATTKSNLAVVYSELGLVADAERLFTEALRVREKVLGPDHAGVAHTLVGFAKFRRGQGRVAEARRMYERGLAIDEKVLGEDNVYLEAFLRPLSEIALAQGRDANALALAERAVQVLERADGFVENKAYAKFLVAQALWNTGRDRERALQLANTALSAYRSAPDPDPDSVREIEGWLVGRAGGTP